MEGAFKGCILGCTVGEGISGDTEREELGEVEGTCAEREEASAGGTRWLSQLKLPPPPPPPKLAVGLRGITRCSPGGRMVCQGGVEESEDELRSPSSILVEGTLVELAMVKTAMA